MAGDTQDPSGKRGLLVVKGALDVHQWLLERGIAHEIVRLPRPMVNADELPELLDLPADRCVVVRLYLLDEEPLAVLVRAGELPDPALLLTAAGGRRLRPADPDTVNAVTDYAAGLVSPLLLPAGLPVLADAAVGLAEVIYAPTGDSGTAVGIPARHLLVHSGARVCDLRGPQGSEMDLRDDVLAHMAPAHAWR